MSVLKEIFYPSSPDTPKPESVGTAAGSHTTGTLKDPEILIQIVKPRWASHTQEGLSYAGDHVNMYMYFHKYYLLNFTAKPMSLFHVYTQC